MMTFRPRTIALATALLSVAAASADAPQSFQDFRKGMLERYEEFRGTILDNYARFLAGEWVEFNPEKGLVKDKEPKPVVVPKAEPAEKPAAPVALEAPEVAAPVPEPEKVPVPAAVPREEVPAPSKTTEFDFYGVSMSLPERNVRLSRRIDDSSGFARQWEALAKSSEAAALVADISDLRTRYGLNDYLMMQALMKYVDKTQPSVDGASRISLCHYVLANLGFDVRLGLSKGGVAALMVPFQQQVYGRTFMPKNGERYYLFTDNDQGIAQGDRMSTCDIPAGIDCGGKLNLRLSDGLRIPEQPREFCVSRDGLELKGTFNANLMPIVYAYPQMDIAEYAASELMPDLRRQLSEQLRAQLAGMPREEAVNKMLRFIQFGFDYATDDEQFGFEKPYFLEEVFMYPKCDCEDRAILYSYLLWNALGVENHIINYPGHVATAVNVDGEGDSYSYQGKRFLISDPTYIGASTGRSMPCYRETKPVIDYVYPD